MPCFSVPVCQAGCQLSNSVPVMYGLRTRPTTDLYPPRFLDPWTDSRSLFPENLRTRILFLREYFICSICCDMLESMTNYPHRHSRRRGYGIQSRVCLSVCLFVRAVTGKRLELSTPNLVHAYSRAVARHALTQRSKGQCHTVTKTVARLQMTHAATARAGVGTHVDSTACVF